MKKNMLFQILQENIASMLEGNPQSEEEFMKQLKKYSSYSPKDIREVQSNHLLNYLMKHEKLDSVFSQGWKDGLIAGEEIYAIEKIANSAKLRRVNPLEIHYVLSNNTNNIDECDMIYERKRMTINEIIDEYYEYLTEDQIDDLETFAKGISGTSYDYNSPFTVDMLPTAGDMYGSSSNVLTDDTSVNTRFGPPVSFNDFMVDENNGGKGAIVHKCTWKSMKKIGILHYLNSETNTEEEVVVDELFKIDKNDPNQWIEWMWINEYWHGVRIGRDMYINIGPKENQYRSIDNLSKCKSGYVGTLYSADNARNVSLMDRVIPWLFYYLVVWYRTELLIATNYGKIANFDLSLMPDGWSIERYMYYAFALKFKFVDAYSEGKKGERKGTLNQTTHDGKYMDMDSSQAIQHNITLLEFIKNSIDETCGITRQRKGQLVPSDTVGGSERSVVQSSYITEPYFNVHNYTKLRAIDCLIKLAQDCIADGSKSYIYVGDDMQQIYGTINGTEFSDYDFETFVSDSIKDQEVLEFMKNNIQAGLQNDKIMFHQIADVVGSTSISELKNKIKQAEEERMQMAMEQENNRIESENAFREREFQLRERELDLKEYEINLNSQTKLAVEEMKSLAFDEGSATEEITGVADAALKQQELAHKKYESDKKLSQEKEIKEKELKIKEKEMINKQKIENLKLQQIREQNKNQIELANKKAKLDEKIANKKIEIEKIKAKKKPATPKKK
jgi:hypothetical protein